MYRFLFLAWTLISLQSAGIKAEGTHQEFISYQHEDGFVRLEQKAQANKCNPKISAARTFGTAFVIGFIATKAKPETHGGQIAAQCLGFTAGSSANLLAGMALEDSNYAIQIVGNGTGYLFGFITGILFNVDKSN